MELKELRMTMMKSKKIDPERAKVLQAILSTSQLIAKEDGNREVSKEDIIQAAKKEAKMAQQSKDSGAPYSEITFEVTSSFLPKLMSEDELGVSIETIISKNNFATMKDMGKVMGVLKKEFTDLYDGKLASNIIRKKLS
jgi:hypothetical protein